MIKEVIQTAIATPIETFILISVIVAVAIIIYRRATRRRRNCWIAAIAETEICKFIGELTVMELKEGFHVDITIKPKTARGNPAGIEPGSVQLSSSNPSVIGVGPNPDFPDDEKKFRVTGLDGSNAETSAVEWRADGDQGSGVRTVIVPLAFVCTQGNAVIADSEVGEPVEDPLPEQPEPTADVEISSPAETPATDAGSGVADSETGNGDAATADQPIAGEDPENDANPVEGTEADSAKPAGEDVS